MKNKNHSAPINIIIRSIYILVFLIVGISQVINAQSSQEVKARLEQLKAKKIAFLSQRMKLTPEEAQVFWPVYNEFVAKKEGLNKEQKELTKQILTERNDLSDKQKEEIADKIISIRLKNAQLESEYHEKFKAVLPIDKVLLLYQSENQFKSELIRQLKEQQIRTQNSDLPRRKN